MINQDIEIDGTAARQQWVIDYATHRYRIGWLADAEQNLQSLLQEKNFVDGIPEQIAFLRAQILKYKIRDHFDNAAWPSTFNGPIKQETHDTVKEGIKILQETIRQGNNAPETHYLLGEFFQSLHDYASAAIHYSTGLRIEAENGTPKNFTVDNNPALRFALDQIYSCQEASPHAAFLVLHTCYSLAPDNVQMLDLYARLLSDHGEEDRANLLCERARSLSPRHSFNLSQHTPAA